MYFHNSKRAAAALLVTLTVRQMQAKVCPGNRVTWARLTGMKRDSCYSWIKATELFQLRSNFLGLSENHTLFCTCDASRWRLCCLFVTTTTPRGQTSSRLHQPARRALQCLRNGCCSISGLGLTKWWTLFCSGAVFKVCGCEKVKCCQSRALLFLMCVR